MKHVATMKHIEENEAQNIPYLPLSEIYPCVTAFGAKNKKMFIRLANKRKQIFSLDFRLIKLLLFFYMRKSVGCAVCQSLQSGHNILNRMCKETTPHKYFCLSIKPLFRYIVPLNKLYKN